MITTAIIYLLYFVIKLFLLPFTLLSDVTINSSFSSGVATASGYINSMNTYIPIDTMLTILGIAIGLETAFLSYKFIMWIIRKIPSIN